ncbi:MAG: phage tail assembly chaperone [Hyphomicrobiaceae bacterium]
MALGLGILRLDSRAFWSLTPREFAAAARAVIGPAVSRADRPRRTDLEALMASFPDT